VTASSFLEQFGVVSFLVQINNLAKALFQNLPLKEPNFRAITCCRRNWARVAKPKQKLPRFTPPPFTLPILHCVQTPTTRLHTVPEKSARPPSHECATGLSIQEHSSASETVFSAMLPIFRGGFRVSNIKLQRSPCPSEIPTSSMALQDCHSTVLRACLAPEGGGCGAWHTSACKDS
jgi:hypothetical protein